ncbi:hypothetical protein T265_09636 [Opisthorchis viverrini]|uniref:Reverse transcriptase domain-containing protein n=1 Tax=Opisthorchis viverrini TaxID=6198 RepID=A0A074Z541_OPIVI|nr:hypothetical protein T265_09636 [Opisthorchis viverrini]KER22211.1 hypothetical protein T265_09636 [Opisthorchis viverrini]
MLHPHVLASGERRAFAAELFIIKCQLNSYTLLDREAKLSYASCLQKLNIHPLFQRVFLNFSGYSLTVSQIRANATKRLHKFRNRSHFSRDTKRTYEKTYYSHASSSVVSPVQCWFTVDMGKQMPMCPQIHRLQVEREELLGTDGKSSSPCSEKYFMEDVEQRALAGFPYPPNIFWRYVNDTFVLVKRNKVSEFLELSESDLNPHIKLRMEIESTSGTLPFLHRMTQDCGKLKTAHIPSRYSLVLPQSGKGRGNSSGWSANLLTGRSVVRTRPLPFDFPCLDQGNLAISQLLCFLRVAWQLGIRRLLQLNERVRALCTEEANRTADEIEVMNKLRGCGYPASLIRRQLRRVLLPVEKPNREWIRTAVIPYKPGTSEVIRRIIDMANISVTFQRVDTLRSALVQLKDRLPANRTKDFQKYLEKSVKTCFVIIITDSMTSVFNADASLPYHHDLFESLIVKKRTFTQAIWIEADNKNATDIGCQPHLVVSPTRHKKSVKTCFVIIITDSMTSVFNADASLPYHHDLFESLIVKKRVKTFTQAIWIEADNKNATDIGCQPHLVVSPTRHKKSVKTCFVIIITDSMTSVFNADASLPYHHDLFESLIVKKRVKTFTQAIWIEADNKNATDIGCQPHLVVSPTRHSEDHAIPILEGECVSACGLIPNKCTNAGRLNEKTAVHQLRSWLETGTFC